MILACVKCGEMVTGLWCVCGQKVDASQLELQPTSAKKAEGGDRQRACPQCRQLSYFDKPVCSCGWDFESGLFRPINQQPSRASEIKSNRNGIMLMIFILGLLSSIMFKVLGSMVFALIGVGLKGSLLFVWLHFDGVLRKDAATRGS